MRQPVFLTAIGILPMAAVVLLRGNIGTDTPSYISAIELIRDSGADSLQLFEPLFEWLLTTLAILPIPAWGILALVSMLTIFLLVIGWIRIEPSLVMFTWIYAQFFVDMTMNGIRYGLAFSLVVFGSRFLVEKRFFFFWIFVVSATFIQISGALLGVLLYFLHEQRWRSTIYATVVAILVGVSFSERLLLKILAYESEMIPGQFSGVVPLVATFLILAIWISDPNARRRALAKVISLSIMSFLFYGVSQMTYAGLRFQLLVLFLSILTFVCHVFSFKIKLYSRSVIALILIGMLLGAMKLRHFDEGGDAGNFIPYKFFWEEVC